MKHVIWDLTYPPHFYKTVLTSEENRYVRGINGPLAMERSIQKGEICSHSPEAGKQELKTLVLDPNIDFKTMPLEQKTLLHHLIENGISVYYYNHFDLRRLTHGDVVDKFILSNGSLAWLNKNKLLDQKESLDTLITHGMQALKKSRDDLMIVSSEDLLLFAQLNAQQKKTYYASDLNLLTKSERNTLLEQLNSEKEGRLVLTQLNGSILEMIHRIQNPDILLNHIYYMRIDNIDITDRQCVDLLKQAQLEELNVSFCEHLHEDAFPFDANLTQLKKLDIRNSSITGSQFASLLKQALQLEELSLDNYKQLAIDAVSFNVNLTKLKKLHADFSTFTGAQLASLLKQTSQLEELDVSYCKNLHENASPFETNLTQLKKLRAYESTLTGSQFASLLKQAPQLEELDLSECLYLHEGAFPFDANLMQLKKLNARSSSLTGSQLASLLKQTSQLEELNLFGCKHLYEGASSFMANLMQLKKLNAEYSSLTSSQLASLIKQAPQLEELNLSSCNQLNTDAFPFDANLTQLKILNAEDSSFTGSQFASLLKQTSQLEELNLSFCKHLHENASPFETNLTQLKKLNAEHSSLTGSQLASLLKQTSQLEELNLSHHLLDDVNVIAAIRNLKHLKELIVDKYTSKYTVITKQELDSMSDQQLILKFSNRSHWYAGSSTFTDPQHKQSESLLRSSALNLQSTQSGSFSQAFSAPRRSDDQKTEDADTLFDSTKKTMHARRMFFAPVGKPHPAVREYRLATFNQLDINPTVCPVSQAFVLFNTVQALIPSVSSIASVSHDLYETLCQLSSQNNTERYYGKTTLSLDHQWQALPSLFSDEILTHYHVNTGALIDIQYSTRDNLYYIKSKDGSSSNVEIDFIVERKPSPKPGLPHNLKQIFNTVASYKTDTITEIPSDATGLEHLKRIEGKKVGACRHCAIAFLHQLNEMEKDRSQKTPVRIVHNDVHAYVEVQINQTWVPLDLGGYEGDLKIDDFWKPAPPTPSSQPLPTAITATSTTTPQSNTPVSSTSSIPIVYKKLAPSEIKDIIDQSEATTFELKSPKVNYFSPHATEEKKPLPLYLQALCHTAGKKFLLETDTQHIDGLVYHLEKHCQDTQKPYFYVNDPDDLICAAPTVQRHQSDKAIGVITRGPGGQLYRFLEENRDKSPVIIINFDHFSEADKVKFNTILDDKRVVDGIELPAGAILIGVTDPNKPGAYHDASFYSRFGDAILKPPYAGAELERPSVFTTEKPENTFQIDLYGSSQWESMLIGAWCLKGKNLHWKTGSLQKALQSGKTAIEILHPPRDPDFERFFREAILRGYFEAAGEKITFQNISLSTRSEQYHFSDLPIRQVLSVTPPQDAFVLNADLFLTFFQNDAVDESTRSLFRQPGTIEANSGKTISIYINQAISLDQWTRLIDTCRQHDVAINVHVAPGVKLSPELNYAIPTAEVAASLPAHTVFIESTDRDVTIKQQQKNNPDAMIIDVSELEASDLLTKLDGTFDKEKLEFTFSETKMFLSRALEEGKTVILHGKLNEHTINRLTPWLLKRRYDSDARGQLLFISEESNPFGNLVGHQSHIVTPQEKKNLLKNADAWKEHDLTQRPLCELLAMERCQVTQPAHTQLDTEAPWIGMRTLPNVTTNFPPLDAMQSALQTKAFNEQRIEVVSKALKTAPFIFLAGMTGVGKTTFVEKSWNNPAENRVVYHEYELAKWANDQTPGTLKTLFIDEATLTERQFSQFEGLFCQNPYIAMNGNVIHLSQEHKIIFAGNPISYSDDRTVPALLERHGNSLLFTVLPPCVIYEEMLRPLFKNTQLTDQSAKISESILNIYQFLASHSREKMLITPRELTMAALLTITYQENHPTSNPVEVARYYAYTLAKPFVPTHVKSDFEKQFKPSWKPQQKIALPEKSTFLLTPANQETASMLDDFLALRAFRRTHTDLTEAQWMAGLGGLTIEGEPGIGKSQLAIQILLSRGLTQGKPESDFSFDHHFYHISASWSLQKKKEVLLKAFFEGNPVIWDEINCSASMENVLNDLLMNKIPNDGAVKKIVSEKYQNLKPRPGFMMIGTQNPITMAGRRKTSDALLHRMHYRQLPEYTQEEMKDIVMHMGLPKAYADAVVSQYLSQKTAMSLTFRHVIQTAKNLMYACQDEAAALEKEQILWEAKKELLTTILTNDDTPSPVLVKIAQETHDSKILDVVAKHFRVDDTVISHVIQNERVSHETLQILQTRTKNPDLLFAIAHHRNFVQESAAQNDMGAVEPKKETTQAVVKSSPSSPSKTESSVGPRDSSPDLTSSLSDTEKFSSPKHYQINPSGIQNFDELFDRLSKDQTPDQRTQILDAVQDKLSTLIKNDSQLRTLVLLNQLTQNQRTQIVKALYKSPKDVLTISDVELKEITDSYQRTTVFFQNPGPELNAIKILHGPYGHREITFGQILHAIQNVSDCKGSKSHRAELLHNPKLHEQDKTGTSEVIRKIGGYFQTKAQRLFGTASHFNSDISSDVPSRNFGKSSS